MQKQLTAIIEREGDGYFSLCPELDLRNVQLEPMAGGHHFGGNYQKIAEILLRALK